MLDALISRSQVFAGELGERSVPELCTRLESLVEAIPTVASMRDRLIVRVVVTYVVSRLLISGVFSREGDVTGSFLLWTASNPTSDDWRAGICAVIGHIAHKLTETDAAHRVKDTRVAAALSLLDARFNDPALTRHDFAVVMNLSVWHANRLLKQQTGCGFSAHIERRRIETAQRLLRNHALSVKQVAAAVGYSSASQLGRHFRRLHGLTPIGYRRSVSFMQPAA